MQKKLQNKFVLSLIALAIVGVIGTIYTVAHSGPIAAHAQTAIVQASVKESQDKETQDDLMSPKPSQVVKQTSATTEKEEANTTNTEKEDGN